jgi:chromosome segregation ATPase
MQGDDASSTDAVGIEVIRGLTAQLQQADSRANEADRLRLDAERRLADALQWLKEAEARAANLEARLHDAERIAGELAAKLRAIEAGEANAQSRVRDLERVVARYRREAVVLRAGLRTDGALGQTAVDWAEQPDTTLESLLREYGLDELLTLVKARRCLEEAGGADSGAPYHGD